MWHRHARLSEWAVWCIMECLARAAMVLELGHEGGSNRDPLHKPIAHFDLKPSNSKYLGSLPSEFCNISKANLITVLMSGKDENHTSNGIFKVSSHMPTLLMILLSHEFVLLVRRFRSLSDCSRYSVARLVPICRMALDKRLRIACKLVYDISILLTSFRNKSTQATTAVLSEPLATFGASPPASTACFSMGKLSHKNSLPLTSTHPLAGLPSAQWEVRSSIIRQYHTLHSSSRHCSPV
jgi:hypothetical protein